MFNNAKCIQWTSVYSDILSNAKLSTLVSISYQVWDEYGSYQCVFVVEWFELSWFSGIPLYEFVCAGDMLY